MTSVFLEEGRSKQRPYPFGGLGSGAPAIRRLSVGALLAAPLFFLLACSGKPPAPAPVENSYTVAAEILKVSAPDAPRREVLLAHEAVPDFVGIDGKVVGMEAMTMPFPVAPSVDLGAYQPADRVRATFVVRFHGSPAYEITRLEKIAPPP